MPTSDVTIDEELVAGLLADQHPDLADLPLVEAAAGWDNVVWRLGVGLAVRLPRRQAAAGLIQNEIRWLPTLAPRLSVAVPLAVRTGQPARGYPWRWAVVPWIGGATALVAPPTNLTEMATGVGAFLAALHEAGPRDAPHNPHRGISLDQRSELTLQHLDIIDGGSPAAAAGIDVSRARSLWIELVETPAWTGPALWIHGDLHPGNLVVREGRLVGVIDFGDLTVGDPATDLLIAWALFGRNERRVFRDAVGNVDDDMWRRGRAWAIAHGAACIALGADDPAIASMGAATLASAIESD